MKQANHFLFRSLILGCFVVCTMILPAGLFSQEAVVMVAPRESQAYGFAESRADGQRYFAERTLHRGLNKAAELMQNGQSWVEVRVASGEYDGQAGQGIWEIPAIEAPQGKLHITGGWNGNFSGRDPFHQPVWLITSEGRGAAFITLGKNSQLKELVISGFVMDARPSNKYDARSNSLLKSGSRSYPLISFGYLATDHLVIADNVFLNGAGGVLEPAVYPLSTNSTVDIVNNFFINNILSIKQLGGLSRRNTTLRTITLAHNSFISNWPYNPDPTSSNVGAVGLYHSGGAQQLVIRRNIFAYNPGGAMQHDWPEDRMPPLQLHENVFFKNAALFDESEAHGVIVGKFGTNPRYLILDLYDIEDDFGYDCRGNTVADPGIPVQQALQTQWSEGDTWADLEVYGYAPPMDFQPARLPLPQAQGMSQYGVQVNANWTP